MAGRLPLIAAAVMVPVVLVVGAVLALAGGDAEQEPTAAAARARADRFDERRAFALLREQVALGPRPAGSPASRRLAERLRHLLPRGRFEPVPGGLRNVVGRIPGRAPAILVAAHYDTKDLPGFVGANDGASGTAVLVEVARALRPLRRGPDAPEIRFVAFDGEESPDDAADFYSSGLRGSRAYAAAHASDLRAMILLDFVGERGLRIPREAGSDRALWARLRAAARRVGAQAAFPAGEAGEVLDDHTPFARRGVPAINLIDFTFPCWHQPCDDLDVVSARSLDLVGETVVELLRDGVRG